MLNITIDGKTFEVPEGTTVLKAAAAAGIKVPVLCDHPSLLPYGACRMCLVEVEGARTLQPACTMPVSNNMVVRTDTEKVHAARRFVLTLIFSERNHFCPFCQVSGGDCELQNAALNEGMPNWPLQPNYQAYPVDASHPHFVLDHNRCILCRRCVRACGELAGNFTLGFEERGARSFLVADLGVPMGESSCISCGSCVQVCPTGALIDRVSAYRGRETQVDHHKTICVGCSVGCGMDVLTRDNNMIRIESDWEAPVNQGVLCEVGRFLPTEEKRDRVRVPLLRKNGVLKAATWEEALDAVADRIKPMPSSVAAVASTRLPAETLYAFQQLFGKKLNASMVTSSEEGVTTALSVKLAGELGKAFEGSLEDLRNADSVVVIGTNLVKHHQVAGFFVKRNAPLGTSVIVIDPNENQMEKLADVVLKAPKAGEVDVIQALAAAFLNLAPAGDHAEAQQKELVALAQKTGLSAETYTQAAQLIANAKNPVIVYGKGITAAGQINALKNVYDLAKLTGAKLLSPKGQANSVAAAQFGLDKAFALDSQQTVFVALGDDEPSERMVQRLEKAPFTVVAAAYTSKLTANADVVLPVTNWAEQEGTYVNLEGRIQKAIKSMSASEDTWTTENVLLALASRLGVGLDGEWKAGLMQNTAAVAITEA
jgi:formate dehydrogenase major subunit